MKFLRSAVQHTSASLTINENYDSDVQADTETFLNKIVPEVSALMFLLSYSKV